MFLHLFCLELTVFYTVFLYRSLCRTSGVFEPDTELIVANQSPNIGPVQSVTEAEHLPSVLVSEWFHTTHVLASSMATGL